MSRTDLHRSGSLVLPALLLVVVANLGVTIHSGHHAVGNAHQETAVQSLAGHTVPDPTLHMDSVSEVRMLTCPGCLLQQQIGDGRLADLRGLDRPAVTATGLPARSESQTGPALITRLTRGPPPAVHI